MDFFCHRVNYKFKVLDHYPVVARVAFPFNQHKLATQSKDCVAELRLSKYNSLKVLTRTSTREKY